jgi:serine/threonine-protein kinase
VADKYKVEHVLGEGGMGIVVLAKHLELGTRVALKVLRGRGNAGDDARFLREAQAVARLESEHVARVLDIARFDDGAPFLVMEYLRGEDLARRLRDHGPIPVADAVGYLLEACEAIAEAHALGIVHRDLKPSNLFSTQRRDGTRLVKVLDFGISKMTRPLEDAPGDVSLTGATAVIGSASYMSPEQLRNSKSVDARTDIWAIGVVLHELVSAQLPFRADSAAGVGALIATAEPRRLREDLPSAPAGLEAVVLRCLQKDPEARFADLDALVRALSQARRRERPRRRAPHRRRARAYSSPSRLPRRRRPRRSSCRAETGNARTSRGTWRRR